VDRFEERPHGLNDSFAVSLSGINLPACGGNSTLGYQYKEWVVRSGQRVYLLGEASDRSGQLVMGKPSTGPCIFLDPLLIRNSNMPW
jgi:E3 Ubiquitin ligase